jgi:WbqC-like protein family
MTRVAIVQSNYIPWRGYFNLIASVDRFILLDDVQYTNRDWRNRNRIKTPQGPHWLTVPVTVTARSQLICNVPVADPNWGAKHWRTLEANYRRTQHFLEIAQWLAPLYLDRRYSHLSDINRALLGAICGYLKIPTAIQSSQEFALIEGKTSRLRHICEQAGATAYVSGPAARAYMDEDEFSRVGISVEWFDYSDLPAYPQLWGDFEPQLSIVDLLFNCGDDAGQYLRGAIGQ